MSRVTEPSSELNLDLIPDHHWLATLIEMESRGPNVVTLACTPAKLERAQQAMLALRAEGVPCVLMLQAKNTLLDDEEMAKLFSFLHDWDQLLLRNFLELCLDWIPAEFHPALVVEARTELKWFQEWQLAANDPRVHKYPTLPWRSFIRKINVENAKFASEFLRQIALPSTPENKTALDRALTEFLSVKKKAVCIFPKRKLSPPAKENA